MTQRFACDVDLVQPSARQMITQPDALALAASRRDRLIDSISSGSRKMSSVSSSDSRSSGLISTNDGLPLRVTRIRS